MKRSPSSAPRPSSAPLSRSLSMFSQCFSPYIPSFLLPNTCLLNFLLRTFADVFCKKQAEILLPHRPYECPIYLLPGTSLPQCTVYPLPLPETNTVSSYIKENLVRGLIRKSSSPCDAGFFFMEKKDHFL